MTTCPIQRVLVVSFSVVPSADRQGVEIETVLKALAPRFQVDVLTIRTADMGYVERYKRTRMLRVPVGSGSRQDQVEAFRRAVKRQLEGAEYDLIHFRSAYGGVPICQLKEYLDCKLVFELAITSSTESGRVETHLLQSLITDERLCVAHADLLITRTQAAAKSLQSAGVGCPVAIVPAGVDIDTFDWEPAVPQAVRRIVCVGTLGPGRGLRTLLEAFAELRSTQKANLVLVGPVEEIFVDYLEDALRRLQLERHVRLLGPADHEEIPRILAMADLCVCPWAPDETRPLAGPPLKLLEYLACRRPTVAPDQPCIRELFGQTAGLVLFPPDDSSALAAAMGHLLSDSVMADQVAEEGYQFIRSHSGASSARRALLTAYSRVFPAGANLWGHDGVSSSSTITSTRSDRFHDTMPYPERGLTVTVTPTGGTLSGRDTRPIEPWITTTPDTASGVVSTGETDTTADPEFIAAGALLTGSAKSDTAPIPRAEQAPRRDTDVLDRSPPQDMAPIPRAEQAPRRDTDVLDSSPQQDTAPAETPGENPPDATPSLKPNPDDLPDTNPGAQQ